MELLLLDFVAVIAIKHVRSMYKSFQIYVCLLYKKCNKSHVQLSIKFLWLQGA